jgi:beta-phosphoglucomutase-like phosphatase (HAD superfamily)
MVRAVVFDFDGVIANSEPLHFRAFRDVLAAEHITLTESDYYARYLGYNDERAFREIAAERGREWDERAVADLIARKAAVTEELERQGSILFPGARDAIARLALMCPLAIASGALRVEIERTLVREQLIGHFATIVSADDGGASKPAPDPYLRAVERLAAASSPADPLKPSNCVAVEDSPWGLDSARAAGLRTVAVSHTYAATALVRADTVVESLDALTWEMLCSLGNVSAAAKDPQNSLF